MSIRSVNNRMLAFSSAPMALEPLLTDGATERRSSPADPPGLSYLTTGDRDLIAAMFGPDALRAGYQVGGKLVGVPEFVAILIEDRQSGRLPAGIEVTSGYLKSIWDHYTSYAGPGTMAAVLTRKNLVDGLYFLSRRSQGGAVDIRA